VTWRGAWRALKEAEVLVQFGHWHHLTRLRR